MSFVPCPRRSHRRAVAALLTLVLALGSGLMFAQVAEADTAPSPSVAASDASSVLNAINHQRALHGVFALRSNAALTQAALGHNKWMAATNTLSHRLSGEHSLGYRVLACGYSWSALAENIGANPDWSSSGVMAMEFAMYAEGPSGGHYQNMMSSTYRDVGVSVYMDSAHHTAWLTIDFGRPL